MEMDGSRGTEPEAAGKIFPGRRGGTDRKKAKSRRKASARRMLSARRKCGEVRCFEII